MALGQAHRYRAASQQATSGNESELRQRHVHQPWRTGETEMRGHCERHEDSHRSTKRHQELPYTVHKSVPDECTPSADLEQPNAPAQLRASPISASGASIKRSPVCCSDTLGGG